MTGAPLASILLLMAACTSSEEPPSRRAPPAPESTLTGTLPKHMRNCPSGVPSAQTTSAATATGVDVTITSNDPAARGKIVELARLQSAQADPDPALPKHSGRHGGPGTIGHCPIIHADTTVTYDLLPDGVRIHVAARAPAEIEQLQRATAARVHALVPPSS